MGLCKNNLSIVPILMAFFPINKNYFTYFYFYYYKEYNV